MAFLQVPAQKSIPDFKPQFTEPLENLVAYFQVGLLAGLAFAMPVIVYHIMRFVSPALSKHERRWAIPISIGGDHLVSLPILRSLAKDKPVGMFQFDSHSDTWAEPEKRFDHGCTSKPAQAS